ncbi:MAG TPA: TonB-dependent receptor plug domain-containing protein, partial [Paucimonas sp.]|nr:TonB-dependent receptor plug domain-containing protein [Paucimonas sp.]
MKNATRLAAWGAAIVAAIAASTAGAETIDAVDGELPVVLTPARMRQSLADVPASVTVITSDMIERLGIMSIPDALRLVPGMQITQASGNDHRINYHGTNILVPRRMNVLIDGISVYRPAMARVDWSELPIAIEDVDRIEVTREPNSASYGANSMLAIINIISKHPAEAKGFTVAGSLGALRSADGTVRYGGQLGASTSYRVTMNRHTDNGFDSTSATALDHDGTRLDKLMFRSETDLGNHQSLDLEAALIRGVKEVASIDRYQKTLPDLRLQEYYLSATWRNGISANHDLRIQAYATNHKVDQAWTTCPPTAMLVPQMFDMWRANPSYANAILAGRMPSGGSDRDNALALAAIRAIRALGAGAAAPTCVDTNQNYVEARRDIELQDTYLFSDTLRLVSGFGLRWDMGDSRTFLDGRVSNHSYRAFANAEYKPMPSLHINAGGYL